jgi:NAD-dependent deacetylase
MEKAGLLTNIITQNIDNLHQEAGSVEVYEFHGNSHDLICTKCGSKYKIHELDFEHLPVTCPQCQGLIKPDFIFFGEGIPPKAYQKSLEAAEKADVFLVIGTTGEIMPASQIPILAKNHGAKIIEINIEPSNYTHSITDIFLQGKATQMLSFLWQELTR